MVRLDGIAFGVLTGLPVGEEVGVFGLCREKAERTRGHGILRAVGGGDR